jgi:hypothetical protein
MTKEVRTKFVLCSWYQANRFSEKYLVLPEAMKHDLMYDCNTHTHTHKHIYSLYRIFCCRVYVRLVWRG